MLATDVLAQHHRLLEKLIGDLAATPAHDPAERRRVLDTLMTELVIHDRVEDGLFYPAMATVSALVPTLHAEQRQLVDQLSVLLRTRPTTDRFDQELALLDARFRHHSFLEEEKRMFPEVMRTVPRSDLERMGDRIAERLDALRHSRLLRMRVQLKRAVLRAL